MQDTLDVVEVAEYLHCSQSTIRKLLRNKQIPSFRVANKILFKKNLIDLWVNNQCLRSCEVMKNE